MAALLSLTTLGLVGPLASPRITASRSAVSIMDAAATRDAAPNVGGAEGIVTGWQQAAVSKIAETVGLTPKEYADEFTGGLGGLGSLEILSYEGPGAPNVAWCSGLTLSGGAVSRGGVTAFCGPLTDVPHLVVSCGVSDGGVDLYIDYRPRAEAGYDPSCASLADYPEPTTREAFAEGSNRKDFASAFYTEEVAAEVDAIFAMDGCQVAAPLSKEMTSAISAGPLLIDVRLPLTDASTAAAANACTAAVDRWLNWMTSAEEMKRGLSAGMRQTATYTRDTKVRAQHFGFLLGRYTALFGDADGKALASADAGPLDEAYVGGGS